MIHRPPDESRQVVDIAMTIRFREMSQVVRAVLCRFDQTGNWVRTSLAVYLQVSRCASELSHSAQQAWKNPEGLLMRTSRTVRFFLLALLISVAAASSRAQFGLSISVGFAPPVLPVYVQPPCPQPNLMWTPGYWAYAQDSGDYFWAPGAWVPAPYSGALWTPPYWGFSNGNYGFNEGYWGQTVGFYGGVNYGFGFGGIGFAGGEWRGENFAYNTAVTQVNVTVIHTTYVNRTIVESGIVANPNHVAYNGGPGGIQHTATASEQAAAHQPHTAPTSVQTQHIAGAKADKTSYAKANGGHPATLVAAKPLAEEKKAAPAGMKA